MTAEDCGKRIDVDGDVAQLVAGDVNEGPRANATGNVVNIHVGTPVANPVWIDEKQFQKATGMSTSAPARVALLRLFAEDIKVKDVSSVWEDELVFQEASFRVRLQKWVPIGTFLHAAVLVMCGIAAILVADGSQERWATFITTVAVSGLFVWWIAVFYRPYLIGRKLIPIIERVNEELPEILAGWRKGCSRSSRD